MEWMLKLIRVAGSSFPVASSLVQLQSEIDSQDFEIRLRELEDPISNLHEDIPRLSEILYSKVKTENDKHIELSNEDYKKFARSLAVVEAEGLIEGGTL